MLISDMFRGMDSTGVFAVNKYGNLKSIKDASSASYFIGKKDANSYFNDFISDYHMVVGHNRKATMGGIQSETAHPFIEGNICLVHNGTLQNHYKLAQRTVDSNAIAAHINEKGYKSLLKNIEGAYALIWYNAEERKVYFTRNAERPLFLVETSERIFLASEDKMLDWILDRNDVRKYEIQNVPTDKVFVFDLETRKLTAESKPKKAEPPKNKYPVTNNSAEANKTHYGQLVLAHSSHKSFTKEELTATEKTYKQGDTVNWRITNWEYVNKSCRLDGNTTDGFNTEVIVHLDVNIWTQQSIDALLRAEWVTGVVSSVSTKKDSVRLYLKTCKIQETIQTANRKLITPEQFKEAGSCCYTCGSVLTEQDIKTSVINVNSKNEIQYITCGICAHGNSFGYY